MITAARTQDRLTQYINRRSAHDKQLGTLFKMLRTELEDASIFGGMVRDFGLGGAEAFNSDIDIVTMSPASDIFDLIKKLNPTKNKYGGYRFSINGQLFDIWSFFDTWAIQEGFVEGRSLEDLKKTTFFSLDAALFKLSDHRLIVGNNYEAELRKRVLSINLSRHPFPAKVAQRAMRMALTKNLSLTPELCEFVVSHMRSPTSNSDAYAIFLDALRKHLKIRPYQEFPSWEGRYFLHRHELGYSGVTNRPRREKTMLNQENFRGSVSVRKCNYVLCVT